MSQDTEMQFLEYLVKGIVKDLDQVNITIESSESGKCFCIKVSREDMGRLIGKNGQTAKAMRTLLRLIGVKHGSSVTMKIVDPDL